MHGTQEELTATLEQAIEKANNGTKYVLQLCDHLVKAINQPDKALQVLRGQFELKHDNEELLLALTKLLRGMDKLSEAEDLLQRAIDGGYGSNLQTEQVYVQAIELKRAQGQSKQAMDLVATAVRKYPKFARFWLLQAELLGDDVVKVRETFESALQINELRCQAVIWIAYAQFEASQGEFAKARTQLQKAKLKMPNDDE